MYFLWGPFIVGVVWGLVYTLFTARTFRSQEAFLQRYPRRPYIGDLMLWAVFLGFVANVAQIPVDYIAAGRASGDVVGHGTFPFGLGVMVGALAIAFVVVRKSVRA